MVADQPLVSVETDKAVVEVPSPHSGTVVALHGKPGDIIRTGEPLAEFDLGAVREDKGTVVGRMPEAGVARKLEEPAPAVGRPSAKVIPAVRALARKLGVDLSAVDATGLNGSITAEDVQRYANVMTQIEPAEPLRGVRRAMAHKMSQSHAEIVPASIHDECDVEDWIDKGDITVRLIRGIAAGCRTSPVLNAWYSAQSMTLRVRKDIDLGIAINTEDGLFVAVMRDVGNREDRDLREGLEEMKR